MKSGAVCSWRCRVTFRWRALRSDRSYLRSNSFPPWHSCHRSSSFRLSPRTSCPSGLRSNSWLLFRPRLSGRSTLPCPSFPCPRSKTPSSHPCRGSISSRSDRVLQPLLPARLLLSDGSNYGWPRPCSSPRAPRVIDLVSLERLAWQLAGPELAAMLRVRESKSPLKFGLSWFLLNRFDLDLNLGYTSQAEFREDTYS